jgi:hypothetical protein
MCIESLNFPPVYQFEKQILYKRSFQTPNWNTAWKRAVLLPSNFNLMFPTNMRGSIFNLDGHEVTDQRLLYVWHINQAMMLLVVVD